VTWIECRQRARGPQRGVATIGGRHARAALPPVWLGVSEHPRCRVTTGLKTTRYLRDTARTILQRRPFGGSADLSIPRVLNSTVRLKAATAANGPIYPSLVPTTDPDGNEIRASPSGWRRACRRHGVWGVSGVAHRQTTGRAERASTSHLQEARDDRIESGIRGPIGSATCPWTSTKRGHGAFKIWSRMSDVMRRRRQHAGEHDSALGWTQVCRTKGRSTAAIRRVPEVSRRQ